MIEPHPNKPVSIHQQRINRIGTQTTAFSYLMLERTDYPALFCRNKVHPVTIRTYVQQIFPVTRKRRYYIATYIQIRIELMRTGIKTDNPLPHCTQIDNRSDTGDIGI